MVPTSGGGERERRRSRGAGSASSACTLSSPHALEPGRSSSASRKAMPVEARRGTRPRARCLAGDIGRGAGRRRRRLLAIASGRSRLAGRGALEGTGGGRRRLAAGPAHRRSRTAWALRPAELRATLRLGVESLRHERRPGTDADLRLGRCLECRGRAPTRSRRDAPPTSSPRSTSPASQRLRLVVKGGGHSYQGTSNAADSLLVWTRAMSTVTCTKPSCPRAAPAGPRRCAPCSVGAGALWSQVYDAVTTQGGGYVQGGGCMTVGVAGLVQSGGFGSFSKATGWPRPACSRPRW